MNSVETYIPIWILQENVVSSMARDHEFVCGEIRDSLLLLWIRAGGEENINVEWRAIRRFL
ncbi:hypothetical protein JL37_06915 [Achromobacter sp. RTa]|nr:hypothetical protein JL37_06915 [Achromobacter sp. RTa]